MGPELLVLTGTLFVQSPQHDSTRFTDQPSHGIAYERLSDLAQYNRVQGLSFGLGYRLPLPATRSAAAYATVRYGLSDERVTWRLSLVQELRRGQLVLSGYHEIADLDPFSPGQTLSNSLNALIAGHDDAEYVQVRGGSVHWEAAVGPMLLLDLSARVERQSSVSRSARSAVNDFLGGSGLFPSNSEVHQGTFLGVSTRIAGSGKIRWSMSLDLLRDSDRMVARLHGDAHRTFGATPRLSLWVKTGAAEEPGFPQTLFRLGGVNTVRGFEYGTLRGPAFWCTQADLTLLRGRVTPVVFLDAGQAAPLGGLFASRALVGGGVGVSLLRGLIRFDVSRRLSPHAGRRLRFDLIVGKLG